MTAISIGTADIGLAASDHPCLNGGRKSSTRLIWSGECYMPFDLGNYWVAEWQQLNFHWTPR